MWLLGPPKVDKMKARADGAGLIRALGYVKDPTVRKDAALALGELAFPAAAEPLAAMLAEDDEELRLAALQGLAGIGDPRPLDAIAALLPKAKLSLRKQVAQTLGRLGDRRAVAPLLGLLARETHRDDGLEGVIFTALATLGDPQAIDPIIARLGDRNDGVRRDAARALGVLAEKHPERALGPLAATEGRTALYATATDPRLVAPLKQLLKSLPGTREQEVAQVAQGLASIGDPVAAAPLIEMLAWSSEPLRRAAAAALGVLGRKQPSLALEALAATEGNVAKILACPDERARPAASRHEANERLQREAAARKQESAANAQKMAKDVDPTVLDLARLGECQPAAPHEAYLSKDGRATSEARDFGRKLDQLGGIEAMRAGHAAVLKVHGSIAARCLEVAWSGIGSWRG